MTQDLLAFLDQALGLAGLRGWTPSVSCEGITTNHVSAVFLRQRAPGTRDGIANRPAPVGSWDWGCASRSVHGARNPSWPRAATWRRPTLELDHGVRHVDQVGIMGGAHDGLAVDSGGGRQELGDGAGC